MGSAEVSRGPEKQQVSTVVLKTYYFFFFTPVVLFDTQFGLFCCERGRRSGVEASAGLYPCWGFRSHLGYLVQGLAVSAG